MLKQFLFVLVLATSNLIFAQNTFSIDYEMAIKTIDWLEYLNTGADSSAMKKYFMENVATTEGCKTIISHWARFRKWDNEIFYNFILEALGRIESKQPLTEKDGSPTSFARRRVLWQSALKNTRMLRKDVEEMQNAGLEQKSLAIARKYLPAETDFKNKFYVVLFGASTAFSVGERNGFDLLQLPRGKNNEVEFEEVLLTFAHELHHTGFNFLNNINMKGVTNEDRIVLTGVLAGEGMPTYFINKPFDKINKLKLSNDGTKKLQGAEWEKHAVEMPNYYKRANEDMKKILAGEMDTKEVFAFWMDGFQGPAYALGANMYSVIVKYSGLQEAFEAAKDYRQFIKIYNDAARKGNSKGAGLFIFDQDLAEKISTYTGVK